MKKFRFPLILLVVVMVVSACANVNEPLVGSEPADTNSVNTVVAQTLTAMPTATLQSTPTASVQEQVEATLTAMDSPTAVQPTSTVVPPTAQAPAATIPALMTDRACEFPAGMIDIVSPDQDWRVVVRMGDGREYQPCLPKESQRPAFEEAFTGYCPNEVATCEMVYSGINSTLMWDSDKDGNAETEVVSHSNGDVITIHNGGWYLIKAGEYNGGISLDPVQ